ncbi:MAG TPA: histone deacetylase [Polyangiaceae bacterium]|nr:histone deacetylase [Polyangiaceae bacterium]
MSPEALEKGGEPTPRPGGLSSRPRLLVVDDPRFDRHVPLGHHPERPERLKAARAALEKHRVGSATVAPRPATDDELARAHDPRFVERLGRLRGWSGHVDPDTYLSPESVDVARLAAGSTVALVDAILEGEATRGVALVRPPGHHARPAQAMGFCLLNNVAVAAAHARARGLERIAIVDWDVHHGNGTQEIFFEDPAVLYASTHQYPFYPGTGAADETGGDEGVGFTLNVPLSAGGGDGVYASAFERVILPVLEAYAPQLVLVSAGFDAARRDPLAEMNVSAEGFGWMARELARVADRSALGRMVLVLEGGYDLVALEACLGSAIAGMMDRGAPPELPREADDKDVARAARHARAAWNTVVDR